MLGQVWTRHMGWGFHEVEQAWILQNMSLSYTGHSNTGQGWFLSLCCQFVFCTLCVWKHWFGTRAITSWFCGGQRNTWILLHFSEDPNEGSKDIDFERIMQLGTKFSFLFDNIWFICESVSLQLPPPTDYPFLLSFLTLVAMNTHEITKGANGKTTILDHMISLIGYPGM